MLKSRLLLVSSLILFFVILSSFYSSEIQNIKSEKVTSWEVSQSADCAVVLTGGVNRVREGLDLLANHRVKKLIISGVYPGVQLVDLFNLWGFYGDLNEQDIVLEKYSETTFGNAVQSLPIVEALRCRDILLVTSKLHMYRAYSTFHSYYPETIQIYKHAVIGKNYDLSFFDILIETTKSLFYRMLSYFYFIF